MSQFRIFGAAGLLALVLVGCSQPVRVDSTWHGEPVAAPLDPVLVVSVTSDLNGRRLFEDLLVEQLARGGSTAWASSRKMDNAKPLQREGVDQAVRETGAMLVVVTRLVEVDLSVREQGERGSLKVQRRHETPLDFFRYDYEEVEPSSELVPASAVTLSTDVYGVEKGRLLYSMDTIIPARESRLEIIEEASRSIADRLRRDGLVR
jgi:hypothetical protein